MPADNISKQDKKLIGEAFIWKERSERATKKFNELKRQIADLLEKKGLKEVSIDGETSSDVTYTAKLTERVTSLKYDTDALKKSLPKDVYNEVVEKTYIITDIDKMVSLLKNAGVSPAEFKKLLQVDEFPLKTKIQELFSVGDITAEQLKDAYTATISKSIMLKEQTNQKG